MFTHKGKRIYDGFPTKTNIDAVLVELERVASKETALQRFWVSKREPKETRKAGSCCAMWFIKS
jgi:hypothetical protein